MTTREQRRYSLIAIAFHWAIAALIFGNLALGSLMVRADGLARFQLTQLHKSIGITVLVLSVLRLGWRLVNPPPAPSEGLSMLESWLSKTVHWGFYAIMIALPITGWAMASASPLNIPTVLYGTVPWPRLPGFATLSASAKKVAEALFDTVHFDLTLVAGLLIAFHLAGVAKHSWMDRSGIISRMLPFGNLYTRRDI